MKIINKLQSNKLSFSFEFFPPKDESNKQTFLDTIKTLEKFNPTFISVTYGALGSTQEKSLDIINEINKNFNLDILAHFTCIGSSKQSVDDFLEKLKEYNIDNILALRGDIPEHVNPKELLKEFNFASDLTEYIKQKSDHFCISVAGYPEIHIEAPSHEHNIKYLKKKIDAGADFVITQLFYDNNFFYDFVSQAKKAGITVPILPGIMPITNFKMIEKITKMCNTYIPSKITDFFSQENLTKEEKEKFAFEYTLNQCQDLVKNGFQNIHFYTLNKALVVEDVCKYLIS